LPDVWFFVVIAVAVAVALVLRVLVSRRVADAAGKFPPEREPRSHRRVGWIGFIVLAAGVALLVRFRDLILDWRAHVLATPH